MFCIQITSVLIIFKDTSSITQFVLLVGFNSFALLGMIYDTKWVWKLQTFLIALKKVIMYEVVLILVCVVFWFFIKY